MLEAIIKRLKRDRRGVSNVIVVMLSLILIVIIVANVVLWSYQMNQFDWEKMQESMMITDVVRVTSSSWFVSQSEYTVNSGIHVSGSYTDTQTIDGQYETFMEISWLSGWDQRVKISIDHNDIDSDLHNFPILIYLSSSSGRNNEDVSFVFDEVGSNSSKIAVTTSDGTTQCYVEIEKWDDVNEQAWLWVKVPTIKNATDTDLYLYYDADHVDNTAYVGNTNSTPSENVWDSHFKLVSHMKDDPDASNVRDSTSNNNDGAKKAANNPMQADGKIGEAQDFSDDHVNCGTSSSLNIQHTLTIEAWVNPNSLSAVHQNSIVDRGSSYWFLILIGDTLAFLRYKGGFAVFSTIATIPTGTFTHVAVTYNNSALDEVKLYINGQLSREGSMNGPIDSSASAVLIGDRGSGVHPFDGIIDEVRIADVVRSNAWIKASHESERDDLLDFGEECQTELDIVGAFVIDLSTYPLTYIQTVEIQLKYRANDTGEKWFLKSYNWSSSTYSNNGFNFTTGHTPTRGWDYYAVNLTDKWSSYVHDDGTVYIKIIDEGADSNQTIIDIDFLAVRVLINGMKFTFQNKGSLTSHLVSLWVNNSSDHRRFDINIFTNSGDTISHIRIDISLPNKPYTVKVVTERGNIAIYSES